MPQALPNLHHIELFYHVARAGGISAAVRSMPYGIQQPAVSGQILELEKDLGVRLFQRRPFQLTPAGRELLDFCAPFFGELGNVTARISGKAAKHLRIAAPTMVIRDHLPDVLAQVKKSCPDLDLTLLDSVHTEILERLEREEIDLAITDFDGKPPTGTQHCQLLELPLVLFLPPGCKVTKKGLQGLIHQYPLISPPTDHPIARLFSKALAKRDLHWHAGIEVSTLDLTLAYVARGFGIGIGVRALSTALPKGVQIHELKGFPSLRIAALWRGKINPLAQQALDHLKTAAKQQKY